MGRWWVVFGCLVLIEGCANDERTYFCGDGYCASDESCSSCPGDCGACAGACGPATCAGCCAGGVCQGGLSAEACGTGGGACVPCGTGMTCTSFGTCQTDPASRWNVVLDTLQVPSKNYEGIAWDAFGGAPDPIVRVYVGSGDAPAGIQDGADDAFALSYGASPVVTNARASDLQALLEFDVYDEDVSDYELIGACLYVVDALTFSGYTESVTCPVNASAGGSGYTLGFHVEPY